MHKRSKCIFYLFTLLLMSGVSATELQVYLTSTIAVSERDKALKADGALSGTNVTVFGKFREFSSSVKISKPTYVIAPSSFSAINKDYKAVYQFGLNGQSKFKYLVLSSKAEWSKNKMSSGSVGIVDELGRTETKKFIQSNVGEFKRVKRVTKADDLMPLLVLENADYIIICPKNYDVLKRKFTAKTNVVVESKDIDYPMFFVLKGTPQAEVDKLGEISADTIKSLGYSEMKKTAGAEE